MKNKLNKLLCFLMKRNFLQEAVALEKIASPDGLYPTKEDLWRSKYYDEVWTSNRDRSVSEIRNNTSVVLGKKIKDIMLESKGTFLELSEELKKNKEEVSEKLSDSIELAKETTRDKVDTYKSITDKSDKYFDKTDKRKILDKQVDSLSKKIDNFEEDINPKLNEIEKEYFGSSSIDLNHTETVIDFLIINIDRILNNIETLANKTETFIANSTLSSEARMSLSEAIYNYRRAENESGVFYLSTFFHSLFAISEVIIQVVELPSKDQEALDKLMIELLRMYKEFARLLENMLEPLANIIPTFREQNE